MSEKKKSLTTLFLEIANPDENGYSRLVSMDELIQVDSRFETGNGGSWCRSDGQLGKRYIIHREKAGTAPGAKIVGVKLEGFREDIYSRAIRKEIAEEIKQLRCVVLAVATQIEVDHKNGAYNTTRLMTDRAGQKVTDFQPLSRAANSAKRGHCKRCQTSKLRFDARRLGYAVPQWVGPEEYKGSCVGCFWYDPLEFNARVSREYQPPHGVIKKPGDTP